MENRFLVDSEFLSPQALARKHQLETDPSSRKSHMEYLPGMEQLHSDVRDKVIGQMESYDPARYTARDVRAALDHETCSVEDFKALLSPAAEPFLEEMAARGCTFAVKHCCNSAGTFAWPEFHLDMVRPGIILYGEQPSADTVLPGLVPALRLRAAVSMVKELAAGDAVSYGCTFRAPKPMRAATLAVGYADGYPRALSGRGTVSLHGRPARVLGRVCMDQIVVDVTDIPDVKAGDAAIVFGGGAADSVDDVARMTGTINYEVLCDVGRRVQRVYVENGAEVELVDYLKGE